MKSTCMTAVLVLALFAPRAFAQHAQCPLERPVLYLSMDPAATEPQREIAHRIIASVAQPNQTVLLRSDVVADFSDIGDGEMPLVPFARCVTLGSFAQEVGGPIVDGRNAKRAGPELLFGSNKARQDGTAFLDVTCAPSIGKDSDGARITGIRIRGPSLDDQSASNTGIAINGCHDVDISNSEVAGWGNAAIDVIDRLLPLNPHTGVPTAEPKEILISIHGNFIHGNQHSTNGGHAAGYGVSVGDGAFARVYQNVFDNNRHSITSSGRAGGYHAAQNLILKGGGYHGSFWERNIHVVDAHGQSGPVSVPGAASDYFWGAIVVGVAFGSLFGPWGALIGLGAGLLAGVGLWFGVNANNSAYTSGTAGLSFDIQGNAIQYKKTLDIKIRGTPAGSATIDNNVFARSDRDAAIDPTDNASVKIGPTNRYNVETYGAYQVCDFDGDGIDDLFLATGVSWWYASTARRQWTFLRADTHPPGSLKVGYFDNDNRCDVITQQEPDEWVISSAGTTDWQPIGGPGRHLHFGHPVSDVQFGRFDPNDPDERPGATRRTTHAFWRQNVRTGNAQWFVTPLTHPDWQPVASSGVPSDKLRFGDFNGDGVTDVLANEGGHWSVSDSARGNWRPLNIALNDPVEKLFIANMDDDDNIDDLLKLDVSSQSEQSSMFGPQTFKFHFTWWRSRNGTDTWRVWREYDMSFPTNNPDYVVPGFAFTGRFGDAHTGSTLIIDSSRYGHFFGRGSAAIPHPVDWLSPYPN